MQGIYTEDQRIKLIDKEYKRITKDVNGLGERATLEKLYREAAFMAVTLDETRQIINRDGITEVYQNGANQTGLKKSAAVEVYDKMVNTYAKVVGQISREQPQGDQADPAAELMAFVRQGQR